MCVVPGDWLAVLSCGILRASRKDRGAKNNLWFQVLVLKPKSKVERVLKEMSSVIVSISYNECDLRSETKAV